MSKLPSIFQAEIHAIDLDKGQLRQDLAILSDSQAAKKTKWAPKKQQSQLNTGCQVTWDLIGTMKKQIVNPEDPMEKLWWANAGEGISW